MLLVLPTKDVSLPNVVGLNKEKAKEVIRDAGLKFKISGEEYNTDVEKDSVIYQNPTYLEKYDNVKKGSTVEVVISKGAER